MSRAPLEVLKERIADAYDVEYVVDVLGITTEMILDAFEDLLMVRRHEFDVLEDPDEEEDE